MVEASAVPVARPGICKYGATRDDTEQTVDHVTRLVRSLEGVSENSVAAALWRL